MKTRILISAGLLHIFGNVAGQQWAPTWPGPWGNNSDYVSTPIANSPSPWVLGGNTIASPNAPAFPRNSSIGTADGAPFVLKASGQEMVFLGTNGNVGIGIGNSQPVPAVLDIKASGLSNQQHLRIYGNNDGDIESTAKMNLHCNSQFAINFGAVGSSLPKLTINAAGHTTIDNALTVGGGMWSSGGRVNIDGLSGPGVVIGTGGGQMAMNICNSSGAGKFLVQMQQSGAEAEFRLIGRTQIGFPTTGGMIQDPNTMVNIDGHNTNGVRVTTTNNGNPNDKMFFVENANEQFDPFVVFKNGKTRIGANFADPTGPAKDAMLTVEGMILATDIRVSITHGTGNHWSVVPDYVFEKDYKLMPLSEVQKYVRTHKHLPDVPSEKEIKAEGVNLVEMNFQLLKKVEELYLHVFSLNEKMNELEKKRHSK